MEIAYVVILILAFVGLVLKQRTYRKKIEKHIEMIGGENMSIETISFRDNIYSVSYDIDGKFVTKTVKFSFFNGEEWF